MPVAWTARPISPPSASISRTRCPFAVPPTAGLQGMCATVACDSVQRPTLQPSRAAACAASTPAWPAPITTTSNRIEPSFPYAEALEDVAQHVFARASADDFIEPEPGGLQIDQQKFFRYVLGIRRVPRGVKRRAALFEQRDVSGV